MTGDSRSAATPGSRRDSSLLSWGVFLVTAGAVAFAIRQGMLDPTVVGSLWRLWPLAVIALGSAFLVRHTVSPLAGAIVVASTLGVVAGGLLGGAARGPLCGIGAPGGGRGVEASGTFLTSPASVELALGCGRLEVATERGASWRVSGSNTAVVPGDATLSVRAEGPDGPLRFGDSDAGDDRAGATRVVLPTNTTLRLGVEVNGGEAQLGLGDAKVEALSLSLNVGSARLDLARATEVRNLSVSLNAGSASVELPNRSLSGSVSANLGSAQLCVPDGAAVRVRSSAALGNTDVDELGLVQRGEAWESTDYASAATRIDLGVSVNAGSVALHRSGGCG